MKKINDTIEMTNKEAAIIIGNLPVPTNDDCYSIPEYQMAKAKAIDILNRTIDADSISREDVLLCFTGEIYENDTIESYIARVSKRIKNLKNVSSLMELAILEKAQMDYRLAYEEGYNKAKEEMSNG